MTTHRTVTLHHTNAARNRGLISYEHVTFSDQISNHCHANPATAIFVVCVALRRDVYGVARPRPAAAAESNMCGRGNMVGPTSILHRRQQCCYKFLTVDPIYPTQLELLMHRVRLCRRFDGVLTRSSAIAEGPRDASCQFKSCQLPRNSAVRQVLNKSKL